MRKAKESLLAEHGDLLLRNVPEGVLEKVSKGGKGSFFDDESTVDAPRALNFEDTEEEPLIKSTESMASFDDLEQMSLYQPMERVTIDPTIKKDFGGLVEQRKTL